MSLINYPIASPTLNSALQFARDAGSILIACAGNGGVGNADVSGPGASPLTISVGTTDDDDRRASFSGTGQALDVVAPGLSLPTTGSNGSADENPAFFSGCSAATPIVAGIATLLLSLDDSLTHDEIWRILTTTAEDEVGPDDEDTPGRDDFFGFGRVNMYAALQAVSEPPPTDSQTCDCDAPNAILGGPDRDVLIGTSDDDIICGFGGDDRLIGKDGNDWLDGGAGDDWLLGGNDNDVLLGQGGHDNILAEGGDDIARGGGGNDRVSGGDGNDVLRGHTGRDVLLGGAGDDELRGDDNRDVLYGGSGDDDLRGGGGQDNCIGGPGTDTAQDYQETAEIP